MYQIRLFEHIVVPRSPADSYRYLVDFSTIEQWDPSVTRARKLTPGAARTGSEFMIDLRVFGQASTMRYRLVAIRDHGDGGVELRLDGEGEGVEAQDRIRLLPAGGGRTRIEYLADLQMARPGRAGGRVLGPVLRRLGRRAVRGLQAALSAADPACASPARPTLADRLLVPTASRFTRLGYRRLDHRGHSRFIDGRTVVISGATGGIGLAAACELARLGARLVIIGRGADRLEQAVRHIADFSGSSSGRAIRTIEADLADAGQRAAAIRTLIDSEPEIDVLINNAGALYDQRVLTADGAERTFAVNLLAPYELTEALLPSLERCAGRVINVSSGGQYLQSLQLERLRDPGTPFDGVKAYARCKRALVSLTRTWAQRHPRVGFHAMHPGWVATPGVERSLPGFERLMRPFLREPRMGADTIVWLSAADAGLLGSGGFWFDRRPAPFDVMPGTVVTDDQAQRLRVLMRAVARAGAGSRRLRLVASPVPA